MKRYNIPFSVVLFTCLTVSLVLSYKYRQEKIVLEKRKMQWSVLKQSLAEEIARFEGETAVVVKDLDMNWQLAFSKDKLFPSASLAKLPIMLSCFSAAQKGNLNLEDKLEFSSRDKVSGSGVLKNMPAGSKFSVEEIIELMVTESDNSATNMLINLMGFEGLNKSFREFGLKNTDLKRKMMDFRARRRGIENYTSCGDMAGILERIYRGELLNTEVSAKCLGLLKQQKINDRIPAKLPADAVTAHKTGLERAVCHDVGIVWTPRGNFLICVLTRGAESHKVAKDFIATVALTTYNYYQ